MAVVIDEQAIQAAAAHLDDIGGAPFAVAMRMDCGDLPWTGVTQRQVPARLQRMGIGVSGSATM